MSKSNEPQRMEITRGSTLAQAKKFIKHNRSAEAGYICPCCGTRRRLKRYQIRGQICRTLARLDYLSRKIGGPVHKDKWCPVKSQGFHPAVLAFYRVIEPAGIDESKPFRRSGYWNVTELGRQFLRGRAKLPRYVIVDDRKRIGASWRMIEVTNALGGVFNPEDAYDLPVVSRRRSRRR